MIVRPRRATARHLGYRRYRTRVASPPGLTPGDIHLRPLRGAPPAHVETVAAPTPAAPQQWGLVFALDGPAGEESAYEMTVAGWPAWRAEISLGGGLLEEASPSATGAEMHQLRPGIDYTARDFNALSTLIQTAIAERVRGVDPGIPVDQATALVELMAYLGDALSYYQDAVTTESYLATARRRISASRHAALLDYAVNQGRSARAWIRVVADIDVQEPFELPARTKLLTAVESIPARLDSRDLPHALLAQPLVFETVEKATIHPPSQLAPLTLDPNSHPGGVLEPGATTATIAMPATAPDPGTLLMLASDPRATSPPPAIADVVGPVIRVLEVREVTGGGFTLTWSTVDAPSAKWMPAAPLCFLPGNIVAADHGSTQDWILLPQPAAGLTYWPPLPAVGTTFTVGAVDADAYASASETLAAAHATPAAAVELRELEGPELRAWSVRGSLLESGPLAPDFVVEVENDGSARLRFGNGTNGMVPQLGALFQVRQRLGGGSAGNIAAGSLRYIVTDDTRVAGIAQCVAATGGSDPEPVDSVRRNAPEQFRLNQRAITPADYADLAQSEFAETITDSAAEISNDGSAPVTIVHVHTGAWPSADGSLLDRVDAELRRRQPLGFDLQVRAAIPSPISIALEITPQDGWAVAYVEQQVDAAILSGLLSPDRFGFGVALHQSEVIALIYALPAVVDVTCLAFAFAGEPLGRAARQVLVPDQGQILRLDNDPAAPEHGAVTYRLKGVA